MYNSILNPLKDTSSIKDRQDFIEEFISNKILLDKIRDELWAVSNIDWILNRIALNRTSPRDLINLKNSLKSILNIIEIINQSDSKKLKKIINK